MSGANPDLERGDHDIARKEFGSPSIPGSPTVEEPPRVVISPVQDDPIQPPARDVSRLSAPMPTSMHSSDSFVHYFRSHLGIYNDPDLADPTRPGLNRGIYERVIASEKSSAKAFKYTSWTINSALGLQIVFAAALTALGAGNGPRSAVTAFGAINTVLASILTFVKGSGLPNRYKYYENEWTKVREYIEQRERDFATGSFCRESEVMHEISIIQQMYENVRKDVEANTPDSYVSNGARTGVVNPPPSLAKRVSDYNEKATSRVHEVEEGMRSRYDLGRKEFDNQVTNTRRSAEKLQAHAVQQISEVRDDTLRQVQQTRDQANSKAKEMEDKITSAAEKAAERVLAFTRKRHQ